MKSPNWVVEEWKPLEIDPVAGSAIANLLVLIPDNTPPALSLSSFPVQLIIDEDRHIFFFSQGAMASASLRTLPSKEKNREFKTQIECTAKVCASYPAK